MSQEWELEPPASELREHMIRNEALAEAILERELRRTRPAPPRLRPGWREAYRHYKSWLATSFSQILMFCSRTAGKNEQDARTEAELTKGARFIGIDEAREPSSTVVAHYETESGAYLRIIKHKALADPSRKPLELPPVTQEPGSHLVAAAETQDPTVSRMTREEAARQHRQDLENWERAMLMPRSERPSFLETITRNVGKAAEADGLWKKPTLRFQRPPAPTVACTCRENFPACDRDCDLAERMSAELTYEASFDVIANPKRDERFPRG